MKILKQVHCCSPVVIGLVTLLMGCPSFGQSATLVIYTFNTVTANTSPSTDTNAFSVASTIAAGAGSGMALTTPTWTTNAGAMTGINATSTALAITNNDYWQFTLTPDSGYALSLVNLTLNARKNDDTGTGSLFFRYSLDGTNFTTIGSTYAVANNSSPTTVPNIDFSAVDFQNLAGPITMRIYGYDRAGSSSIRIDNITLNGDVVAVPEPSVYALLGFGLGCLWLLRRKKAVV